MNLFGLFNRRAQKSDAEPQRDKYSDLFLEEGLPHVFCDSSYGIKGYETDIVSTPLGDVVVRRHPCSSYTRPWLLDDYEKKRWTEYKGLDWVKSNPNLAVVGGFYKSVIKGLSSSHSNTYEVDPIPDNQREDVAAALRNSGYKGWELNFDPSVESRIVQTQCRTGLRLTPKNFKRYVDTQMSLAQQALEAERPKDAVRYLVTASKDADYQVLLHGCITYESALPYRASVIDNDFRTLFDASLNKAYTCLLSSPTATP